MIVPIEILGIGWAIIRILGEIETHNSNVGTSRCTILINIRHVGESQLIILQLNHGILICYDLTHPGLQLKPT